MADIISIATAVPAHCHDQQRILGFMQTAYSLNENEKRKLAFLYHRSQIKKRYSVLKDFGTRLENGQFFPADEHANFPDLDARMQLYKDAALPLGLAAIKDCLKGQINSAEITHLITVSCTGMSAPGLDLEIAEAMQMPPQVFRTSINFMGCYAAIHGLKMAKMICDSTPNANVMVVCVELCTIHFQKEYTLDNAASSLLFADGAAAVLVSNQLSSPRAIRLQHFYSHVNFGGKADMGWALSSKGFLMTLSSYIPQLIQADIAALVAGALQKNNLTKEAITHWCIHPGGSKIIDAIQKQLQLCNCHVQPSRNVLADYGNMSSPTILFVLKDMMENIANNTKKAQVFGVAFGPGLTMETFTATQA